MLTFDFGESWSSRNYNEALRVEPTTDVNALLADRLARTTWLWTWTLLITVGLGVPIGLLAGLLGTSWRPPTVTIGGAFIRATPVFIVTILLLQGLLYSERLFFGFDWTAFLVETPTLAAPLPVPSLTNPDSLLLAIKRVLPPAFALSTALLGTTIRVGHQAVTAAREAPYATVATAKGVPRRWHVWRYVCRNALLPFVASLRSMVAILFGGTLIVGHIAAFDLRGFGTLFYEAATHGDYTTLQALLFVMVLVVLGVTLLQDVLYMTLAGRRTASERQARIAWTARKAPSVAPSHTVVEPERLHSFHQHDSADSLVDRVRATSRPAVLWLLAGLVLFTLEAGALLDTVAALPGGPHTILDLPTLLSREHIPNQGYWTPESGWVGTFLGLSPAAAWALRVGLVFLYVGGWVVWLWVGYQGYRTHYRGPTQTPTDRVLGRFCHHPWGLFGASVLGLFVVAAVFAPTLGDATRPHESRRGLRQCRSDPPSTTQPTDVFQCRNR